MSERVQDKLAILREAQEFDEEFLHNYGSLNPIPIGAVALCGAVSRTDAPGEIEPEKYRCCPICVALTENHEKLDLQP